MHTEAFVKRKNNPLGLSKPMEEHIAHFKQRLKERFDLEITEDEYYDLIDNIGNAKRIYPLNSSNSVHSMKIHNKEVWVIYGKNQERIPARLKTAMIPFEGLVVPDCLDHKYNHKMFTARVGEVINEMVEVSKMIDLNDLKSFFVGHQEIPKIVKSIALIYKKHGDAWNLRFIGSVIRYLLITEGGKNDELLD